MVDPLPLAFIVCFVASIVILFGEIIVAKFHVRYYTVYDYELALEVANEKKRRSSLHALKAQGGDSHFASCANSPPPPQQASQPAPNPVGGVDVSKELALAGREPGYEPADDVELRCLKSSDPEMHSMGIELRRKRIKRNALRYEAHEAARRATRPVRWGEAGRV